ncbi:hypothetical protein [Streptomyces sp. NPDC001880]
MRVSPSSPAARHHRYDSSANTTAPALFSRTSSIDATLPNPSPSCSSGSTVRHTVFHDVPYRRAIAAIVARSRLSCPIAQPNALFMIDSHGATKEGTCSTNVF